MIKRVFHEMAEILASWESNQSQVLIFNQLLESCKNSILSKGKIVFLGNGGSAAEANHLAAEFIGKCSKDSAPMAALSLSESSVILSALGNDYGFRNIFSRQVQALVAESDVVIGMSTSGTSQNIVDALIEAKKKGACTSLWTSNKLTQDSLLRTSVDHILIAPTISTPRAQELHLLWGHTIAEIIEREIV